MDKLTERFKKYDYRRWIFIGSSTFLDIFLGVFVVNFLIKMSQDSIIFGSKQADITMLVTFIVCFLLIFGCVIYSTFFQPIETKVAKRVRASNLPKDRVRKVLEEEKKEYDAEVRAKEKDSLEENDKENTK